MKNKWEFAFVFGFFSVFLIVFIVALFVCINNYNSLKSLDYLDLYYEELTFEKCVVIDNPRGGTKHEIYFEEYEEPFLISSAVYRKINLQELSAIEQNTKTEIYYQQTHYRNYTYEIYEMNTALPWF